MDYGTSLSRQQKSLMQTLNEGKVLSTDNNITFSGYHTFLHSLKDGQLSHFPAPRLKGLFSQNSFITISAETNKAQWLLLFSVLTALTI
jgi:hypothetical protein